MGWLMHPDSLGGRGNFCDISLLAFQLLLFASLRMSSPFSELLCVLSWLLSGSQANPSHRARGEVSLHEGLEGPGRGEEAPGVSAQLFHLPPKQLALSLAWAGAWRQGTAIHCKDNAAGGGP